MAWLDKQFSQIDKTLDKQFSSLHTEHAVILKRINELGEQIQEIQDSLDKVPAFVSPELEAVINTIAIRALTIDRKVPDISTQDRKKG